jgi:DNA-binding GntR family transcriptional regulator
MVSTLKVTSLVEALHAAIRDAILTGGTAGGTPLTEMDIADEYSVSRPTAKAAMERLVHEGLLRRSSNKTARVPILNIDDVRDLYYSRGFLEREVMMALARKRSVPEEARRSLDALRELLDDAPITEIVGVDIAFHRALVSELGSARLSRLYNSLAGEMHLCMAQVQAHHLLLPSRIAEEHAGILAAIAKGDETRAVARITAHLDRASTRLIGYLNEADRDALAE